MTQKFTSLILVLALFSYQSYHSLVYINYFVNYDYFANVLCENKGNPEKPGCNGKCHLKKQLDQQKSPTEESPFSKSSQMVYYPDILGVLIQKIKAGQARIEQYAITCPLGIKVKNPFLGKIFHPPKTII